MPATLEIKTRPVKKEVVSPSEFLRIPKSDIKSARVIPPKLGSKSLGKVRVEYKHTKYKPA